jgi:hypothetical protein
MTILNPELMYEFHARELSQTEALKKYADHVVKEIKTTAGWDSEIHVNVEPAVKDKNLFLVSMTVFGLGQPIVVKKMGKRVLSLMKKVRKAVLRQIHNMSDKKCSLRKRKVKKYIPNVDLFPDLNAS